MAVSAAFFFVTTVLTLKGQQDRQAAAGQRAQAGKEIRDANVQQSQIEQRIAEEKSRRARAKTIRQARIRRGQLEASSQATGTIDSSGYFGASSSIQSQTAGSIGSSLFTTSLARSATNRNIEASKTAQLFFDKATSLDSSAATSKQAASLFGNVGTVSRETKGFTEF